MKDIVSAKTTEIAVFDPKKAAITNAKADAGIDYAKRVKDWPTLEAAVAHKIENQKEFVGWWEDAVRRAGEKANNADRGYFVYDAEILTGIKQQQVSRWRNSLKDETKYQEVLYGPSYKKAMAGVLGASRGVETTHDNEWFTPLEFIELARKVLGKIDLDPASHPVAQERVRAGQFFTISDDGLKKKWSGNVWMNPPYAQPQIGQFLEKLISEFVTGDVHQAIALTHNYTDTSWFHRAASVAVAMCFTRGRIRFESPDGRLASPTQGQTFFYFGQDAGLFSSVFSEVGFVVRLV